MRGPKQTIKSQKIEYRKNNKIAHCDRGILYLFPGEVGALSRLCNTHTHTHIHTHTHKTHTHKTHTHKTHTRTRTRTRDSRFLCQRNALFGYDIPYVGNAFAYIFICMWRQRFVTRFSKTYVCSVTTLNADDFRTGVYKSH